eukprot:CAMPEP_0179466688 /NCGR_PEP_ID=MMETSP0799-20121207/47963_1 /TAXON_ID=46947 /ORGANISM="Geminigera cryophila, Strain CCMP2564" /LENGTH=214 /DNA_ID=CAMNT_0021271639 /DNA_START=19 /DNA_END=660 /DNA_ORIENTATION=-
MSHLKKQHGGLETLYRDKPYLELDEEQKAKRMLVLSKKLGQAWVKTEEQAICDRAKVLGIQARYDAERHKFKIDNVVLSAKGGEDEYVNLEQLSKFLDKTRMELIGGGGGGRAPILVAPLRVPRVTSHRVTVDGGTISVQELERSPPLEPALPEPKKGTPAPGPEPKVRQQPWLCPTAVLDRGFRRGRRRVLIRILKMGPSPIRIGAFSGAVEA